MIFIFDWGYQTEKNYGPLSCNDAPFQLDGEMVWLVRQTTWFRAFFIPLIPTKTRYYYQLINADSRAFISSKTFHQFKELAILNRLAMEDKISDETYRERRKKMKI